LTIPRKSSQRPKKRDCYLLQEKKRQDRSERPDRSEIERPEKGKGDRRMTKVKQSTKKRRGQTRETRERKEERWRMHVKQSTERKHKRGSDDWSSRKAVERTGSQLYSEVSCIYNACAATDEEASWLWRNA
jgi:hypothetical protein